MKEKKDSSNKKRSKTQREESHEVIKDPSENHVPEKKVSLKKKILAVVLSILLIFAFFLAIVLTSPFIHF